MYPPKHHQEANFDNILRTIACYPLATLVTSEGDNHFITHLPLIYYPNDQKGCLIGHMDKSNPHARFLYHQKTTAVFHGPDTYISPNIYASKGKLPTWNYIKVHITGDSQIITCRDRLKESIVKMTEFLEGEQQSFVLKKDNPQMDRIIDYIVGFEITIDSWEGKFKLSQDKNGQDFENAKAELTKPELDKKSQFISSIYHNHRIPD